MPIFTSDAFLSSSVFQPPLQVLCRVCTTLTEECVGANPWSWCWESAKVFTPLFHLCVCDLSNKLMKQSKKTAADWKTNEPHWNNSRNKYIYVHTYSIYIYTYTYIIERLQTVQKPLCSSKKYFFLWFSFYQSNCQTKICSKGKTQRITRLCVYAKTNVEECWKSFVFIFTNVTASFRRLFGDSLNTAGVAHQVPTQKREDQGQGQQCEGSGFKRPNWYKIYKYLTIFDECFSFWSATHRTSFLGFLGSELPNRRVLVEHLQVLWLLGVSSLWYRKMRDMRLWLIVL